MIKKIKEKTESYIKSQSKYGFLQNKIFLGLILLFTISLLIIISIVNIIGFTTFHAYTFSLLFGYYCYPIYAAGIFYSFVLIFNLDAKIRKFISKNFENTFNFSWLTYLFFILGVILITESSINIHSNPKESLFPWGESFSLFFGNWWKTFTSSKNAALPNIYSAGIIPTLIMSFISLISGLIIPIIIGSCIIISCFIYVFYGNIISKNKEEKASKGFKTKKELEEHETKILDLDYETKNLILNQDNQKEIQELEKNKVIEEQPKIDETKTIELDNSFYPFDDPFEEKEKNTIYESNFNDNDSLEFDNNSDEDTSTFEFNL